MTTVAERWISLEGAVNVRDIGGLPLEAGGTTAAGRLLRGDNLQGLTASDVRLLVGDLRLRLVLDLRTEVEVRLEGRAPLEAEPTVRHETLSLLPVAGRTTDVAAEDILPWADDTRRSLHRHRGGPEVVSRLYAQYLRDRPDSVVAALRAVAELADGAAIVHCAAGKDRTGVVCALALAVAGATREAIVADYVATAERIEPLIARLRRSPTYADDLDGRPAGAHTPRPETMERVLDLLDERHGGPLGWLEQAGLGADDAGVLRARLRGTRADQRVAGR